MTTTTAPSIETLDAEFLSVMGGVCAPVVVVTAAEDGRPHGTTVSAFASLSRRPPMIMLALDEGSDLLQIVRRTGTFGVNVLSQHQPDAAMSFAKKGADKFEGVEWDWAGDLPRLSGSTGWLQCEATSLVPGGDHTIVLGTVIAAADAPDAPLVYHRRVFGTHHALDTRREDEAAVPRHPLATTYGSAMKDLFVWMDFD